MGVLTVVCSECMNIHDREVAKCERCKSPRLAMFNCEQKSSLRESSGKRYAEIPSKIRYRRSTTQDAILLLLESGEMLTGGAVAKRLRISWIEATNSLAELTRRGEIEESDAGVRLYAVFGG